MKWARRMLVVAGMCLSAALPVGADTVAEAWRGGGFCYPRAVDVNPTDGSCWVADRNNDQVVHLAEDGTELWRGGGFGHPHSVSVNVTDASCWVADTLNDQVVHLAEDGSEVWRGGAFFNPCEVSANPTDGSCWVADTYGNQVVHLAEDGTELWRGAGFDNPDSVSVDPVEGSCYVTDSYRGQIVHLAEDGTELWRLAGFAIPWDVSVNPTDGSCWVADTYNQQVVHLAADGTELWRGGTFVQPQSVSVDATDGSCWVANTWDDEVVHLAEDGSELWRGGGFYLPETVSANPTDGSCWVADSYNWQIVHLVIVASNVADFSGTPTSGFAPLTVTFTDLSTSGPTGWAWHFGDGGTATTQNPTHQYKEPGTYTVTLTAQDAEGSDTAVKPHYILVTFPDVPFEPEEHWALHHILACVDAGIVSGYDDGLYHPDWPVTRDQMAVYISRALVSPSGDAAIPAPEPPPSFSDVPPTHWAYKHIEYAVSQSVVKGYDDGTYQPGLTVDRGQMGVYVARAMVAPGGDAAIPDPVPPATFPDVSGTFWAYKQVEYCVGQGVVKGYDDGLYHPGIVVTRDQMAVYVARAFGLEM